MITPEDIDVIVCQQISQSALESTTPLGPVEIQLLLCQQISQSALESTSSAVVLFEDFCRVSRSASRLLSRQHKDDHESLIRHVSADQPVGS